MDSEFLLSVGGLLRRWRGRTQGKATVSASRGVLHALVNWPQGGYMDASGQARSPGRWGERARLHGIVADSVSGPCALFLPEACKNLIRARLEIVRSWSGRAARVLAPAAQKGGGALHGSRCSCRLEGTGESGTGGTKLGKRF